MLTFAALQMPPNQRHHQRPVLRLLMSMSQPDTASPCFPFPSCLLPAPVSTLELLLGRFYQTASRQMRYLFLVWLITSCLPALPASPASPAWLLLCLCYCHPSIDCVVRVPPFVLTSNRYEHISVTNASTCPNKANNLMTMLREGE